MATATQSPAESDWMVPAFPPQARFLFKPIENCQTDGCHMDFWAPKEALDERGSPIVIFIHGGGFSVGSSKDVGFNQIKWLLSNGIACVSIEYRLLPHVTHIEIRSDVLDAYKYIQYGSLQAEVSKALPSAPMLDVSRCAVTGGSAGGTCSLMLGADIDFHNASSPPPTTPLPSLKAVLSAFPLVDANNHAGANPKSKLESDLKEAGDEETYKDTMKIYEEKVCTSEPYLEDVFTKNPPRTPRQLWVKAAFASWTLNSFLYDCDKPYPATALPISAVTSTYPPTWLYCAIEDDLIPVQQTYNMGDRLRELGVEVHADGVEAPHGYTDLPMRYFPERAEGWWKGSILPSMEWLMTKLR